MRPTDPSNRPGLTARQSGAPTASALLRGQVRVRTLGRGPRARVRVRLALATLVWLTLASGGAGAIEARPDTDWLPGRYVDYAPAGLPDFSQCRAEWSQPGHPPQWTHAGPVALADLLWWLDSRAEVDPQPPERVHDGHGLVTAYPVFGPTRDDHAQANLGPLVLDLAVRSRTNADPGSAWRGSSWANTEAALRRYVSDRGLAAMYPIGSRLAPDRAWLAEGVSNRAGILLLLGVWESQAQGWRRVGGHYAAVAGIDGSAILLADPLADLAGLGGPGRRLPEDPSQHSCREAPAAHDDAAIVSHDRYALVNASELPTDALQLDGYFEAESYGEAAAFQSQNAAGFLSQHQATWQRGPVLMAIDAALALVPVATPSLASTPDPVAPSATATPRASVTVPPTARPSSTPEPESSASPSTTRGVPSPAPSATRSPDPSRLYLPCLGRVGVVRLW